MTIPAGRTGFQALQQSMEEAKARGSFSGQLDYFKCDEGETKVVRFLTDDVKTDWYAQNVTTANGKKMNFLIPDKENNLLLRYAAPGAWDGKLTERTAGVMVLRQRVPDTEAGLVNGRQKMKVIDHVEQRDDGSSARIFYVAVQGHNNFWDQAIGYFGIYGTITDRDYMITRRGQKLETKYTLTPIDPSEADPALQDPKVLHEAYGYGRPWDKDDPNRFWWCPQTLEEWRVKYAGEERVKFFMLGDGQKQAPQQQGAAAPNWTQQPPAAPPAAAPPGAGGPAGQWGPPPAAPAAQQPAYAPPPQNGMGEFNPATTHNPEQPAPTAVAPEDQDFSKLRSRLGQASAPQA